MNDISLKELLEAGCHFGHRVERWHPKASKYIYQAREGIHIIDLAKTKEGLVSAAQQAKSLAEEGKTLLFVGTKRQARAAIMDAAKKAGASYLTSRWIGGFITNWEEVKKNIDKILSLRKGRVEGEWQKYPKHEQVKMEKHLRKLESVYGGVVELSRIPDAIFVVDIRREDAALREAARRNVIVMGISDTNADDEMVQYPIPANDDAIGSISCIVNYIAEAYLEGRDVAEKRRVKEAEKKASSEKKEKKNEEEPVKKETPVMKQKEEEKPKTSAKKAVTKKK